MNIYIYICLIGGMNHYPLQFSELLYFFCTMQISILSLSIDWSYFCSLILRDVNGHRFMASNAASEPSYVQNPRICLLIAI